MTPTPCPKCGTMLDHSGDADFVPWESIRQCEHTSFRCRDVLHAQLTAERVKVEEATKALETASQFCKDGHDDGFPSECHCGWCETRTVVDAALEKLRGQ